MRDIQAIIAQMTPEEKARFVSGRDFWHTQDIPRLDIPAVMVCDGPNGLRKQDGQGDHLGINTSIETVCYPSSSAMASSFDPELLAELGLFLGRECVSEHVAMLLGPGVNMKRSPLCGRNFEYLSEDPWLAGELATAYIRGLQSTGTAACIKHFACNNQETRRMSGDSRVDERTLHEIYLPAFEKAVKDGKVRSVMCAYNGLNGTFCAENHELLTDILRKDWGFDGFVVTDWGAIKDRPLGLLAGVDLEMPGPSEGKTAAILSALAQGTLPMEALDRAVENLLRFVLDASEQQAIVPFDREAARSFSADCAAQCAVLLKNDGVLPLAENQRVAFIGSFAEKPRYQGAGSSHINVPHAVAALECVAGRNVVYAPGWEADGEAAQPELWQAAIAAAQAAEVAVIFAGLPEAYETEGCDREHMALPDMQNALIEAIAKVQPNVVVVLHGGSAMELPWRDQVRAILTMHLGGDGVGRATVELLWGEREPAGRLAESWPVKLEDNPSYLNFPGEDGVVAYREGIFMGYRYYDKKKMPVAFPFGHGLSYTQFAYGELHCSSDTLGDGETLTLSLTVTNTGTRRGAEVVQLYAGWPHSAVARPVRELKGFRKIWLDPGASTTVTFTLAAEDLRYWEKRIHGWMLESGACALSVGASSRDIRCCHMIEVRSTQELPVHYDRNSTVADLGRTAAGRTALQEIIAARNQNRNMAAEHRDMQNLGAGSERMMHAMMQEMPLTAFTSYGVMDEVALDALIARLNQP